ncbi:MAG: hypothetical protein E7031_09395 [Akkermansiaceae bacterium]|nr:hypothetical protein [Akkermansiaceae bacterium]
MKLGLISSSVALLCSGCYFNTAGHIFDAASHDVCVRASDIKVGQKIYSDGSNYYLTLPKYRYEPEVLTLRGRGELNRSVARLSHKEGTQVVKIKPEFVQYLTSGSGSNISYTLAPVDEDVLSKSSCVGSVGYLCDHSTPQSFTETSSAAPWLYFLGALDWLCVDLPVTLTQNAVMVSTGFPLPISLAILSSCVDGGESRELLEACTKGDYATVNRYVEAGVDFSKYDRSYVVKWHFSPPQLMNAALDNHHYDIVKLLMESGFTEYNELDLTYAVLDGRTDIAAEMFSKGASVKLDVENSRFLRFLREGKTTECIKLLPWISKKELYNSYRYDFKTIGGVYSGYLLHFAAEIGDAELVRHLIAAGFNVNCTTSGYTPLDIAEHARHKEIVRILQSHGGKKSGKKVLDYIKPRNCPKCNGQGSGVTISRERRLVTVSEVVDKGDGEPYTIERDVWVEEPVSREWTCSNCNGRGVFYWDADTNSWTTRR